MRRFLPAVLLWIPACAPIENRSGGPHYLQQADASFLRGDYAAAAASYEEHVRVHSSDPNRARVLVKAGRSHLGAGKPDLAAGAFDAALAASPDAVTRAEATFRRAVAHRQRGEAARALDGFRSAAAAPERAGVVSDDELRFETALAHFRAGDWKAGHAELLQVSDRGAYRKEKAVRAGLATFVVQAGEFVQEGPARAQEVNLRRLTSSCVLRTVRLDEPLFVVTAGTFARHEDAQREADRLKALGYADARVLP